MRFQKIFTVMMAVLFAFSIGVVAQEEEQEKSKEQKIVEQYIKTYRLF